MPWIDPKSLTLELQGRTCLVCAPYWSVIHDLDRGGTPVELRFAHGPAGNVLREPLAARVDRWSEADNPVRLVSARKNIDGIELIFRSASKTSGLAFQTTYHYTPYQLRREIRLSFPRGYQARRITGLHAAWGACSDRFWKTGCYPCYRDRRDMQDLDRMIRTVHRYGMKIVPYTCPTELHPEMPTFPKNIPDWRQEAFPDGGTLYHPAGKSPGGYYGTLVCPDSAGWRDYYLRYVKTLLHADDYQFFNFSKGNT